MSARVAIIHIDYNESSPLDSYKGSYVVAVGKEITRFVSSEPDEDVMSCIKYAQDNNYEMIYYSSSVDNYFIDIGDN